MTPTSAPDPSPAARRGRTTTGLALAAIATLAFAGIGCSSTPPTGTPIIRAVPVAGEPAIVAPEEDGVIVLFKPGDRIDLALSVQGSIGHVEGEGQQSLVIDREFMVWARENGASISFDDGRTWRSATKAMRGSFAVDWKRAAEEQGGSVSEVALNVMAEPR